MAWVAHPEPGAMDAVVARQLASLRKEMDSAAMVLPALPSGRKIGVTVDR
jgi:hypothetical protein